MLREKMARKFRRVFDPLAHVALSQQPASNIGGGLRVVNFADEERLRGLEDFFAALQDGGFEAFDIDLDQTGQGVLPRNGVQSDGVDLNWGFRGADASSTRTPRFMLD